MGISALEAENRSHNIMAHGYHWCHLSGLDLENDRKLVADLTDDRVTQRLLIEWHPSPTYEQSPAGHVLIVKGPNMNSGEAVDDLVALRMLITPDALYSFAIKPLSSVETLQALPADDLPQTPVDLALRLTDQLLERHRKVAANFLERLDTMEDEVLDPKITVPPSAILIVRRQVLALGRGLSAQAEALEKMKKHAPGLTDEQGRRLKLLAGTSSKLAAMMETVKQRAESVAQMIDQQQNAVDARITYLLTLAAGIFLPVNLLAGMFGVNVGGMPWLDHPHGFWIFIGLLVGAGALATLVALWLLRRQQRMTHITDRGNHDRP